MYLQSAIGFAQRYSGQDIKRNNKSITLSDYVSLVSMLSPGILFIMGLGVLSFFDQKFLVELQRLPFEILLIAICGSIATLGGIGDWLFHRYFVTVGPKEHASHLLALCSGGLPLFVLMVLASLSKDSSSYLIPIIICALYTAVLICHDEFVFHLRRCKAFETLMHRLLVFGNAFAWLAWMHWIYVGKGG